MIGQKLLIRLVGTLTCVAAVAAGWDAEAARCHHRRASCCYETPCCDPCSTPVYTASCAPTCERVCVSYRDPCTNCCTRTCSYRVVEECAIAVTPACCSGVVIASVERPTTATVVAETPRPAVQSVVARR